MGGECPPPEGGADASADLSTMGWDGGQDVSSRSDGDDAAPAQGEGSTTEAAADGSRDEPPDASQADGAGERDAEADATDARETDASDGRDARADGSVGPLGCWSEPRKSNVLVLIYNPSLVAQGHSLRAEVAPWHDPAFLSVRLAEHVRNASHGLINYDVVEFRELVAWPKQLPDAVPVNEMTYFHGPPPGTYKTYEGGNADYADIFESQNLCSYLAENDVSEVWLWGAAGQHVDFGFDGFAYKFMGDALPSSSPTDADRATYDRRRKTMPDCNRSVWVMGFSYTFGFDPRIYNLRAYEILDLSLRGRAGDGGGAEEAFSRFSRHALGWPDDVQVGTPAFPPNGGLGLSPDVQAWDYTNRSVVQSGADDWYGYPALTGTKKAIDCGAWGCSNEGFQAWYAAHIPHAAGGSIERGCNNWWKYIADSDGRLSACSGDGCGPEYAKGQSCASDAQCASRHCSCQGSRMLCTEAAGPACPNPTWDPCTFDEDCLSRVCGCNGGSPPKKCLPDERYPRECTPP
jgi:hypothetical protein